MDFNWSEEDYEVEQSLRKFIEHPCEQDCTLCSGEYCNIHHLQPCECDVIDRHSEPPPLIKKQISFKEAKDMAREIARRAEEGRQQSREADAREFDLLTADELMEAEKEIQSLKRKLAHAERLLREVQQVETRGQLIWVIAGINTYFLPETDWEDV